MTRILFDSNHYSGTVFGNPARIVAAYQRAVAAREIPPHDTLVGTGISGSIAVSMLALTGNVFFAVVRKPNVSSHSDAKIEGIVGERWLFVDDFISSGNTHRRVQETVACEVPGTTQVGAWLYRDSFFIARYEKMT